MRTATVREAQHHLSKLLEEIEAGEEIILTRRGKPVARLTGCDSSAGDGRIDWRVALRRREEALGHLPPLDGDSVLLAREGERY